MKRDLMHTAGGLAAEIAFASLLTGEGYLISLLVMM